ncbi:MAG: chemotaxis-specific protein-glutamate methyltransferase CheB [bacterium]|nr:chemotaxis-specific protein-glutamate methyltransferase CheB [bacterium]
MINVLICDDSTLLRVTLKQVIESDPKLKVVDMARNGKQALELAEKLRPDVITMDVHMPVMDGISALKEIVHRQLAPVIMISSAAAKDAGVTVSAMENGAVDFISKPDGGGALRDYAADIIQKIKHAAASNIYRKIKKSHTKTDHVVYTPVAPGAVDFKVVVLGLSTGGPKSIYNVLPKLPADLNAAVIIVQHMPAAFITPYAQHINSKTAMPCHETEAGMALEPGNIYVAKGGYHLMPRKKINGKFSIRQTAVPKHLFMPSVDIVMGSVLKVFGNQTIGVLMTGMGRDGAEGMLKITEVGGVTIAESKETAIVFGMPNEAILRGGAKHVVPNYLIANEIIKAVG